MAPASMRPGPLPGPRSHAMTLEAVNSAKLPATED